MKRAFYIFIYLFIIIFVSACNIEINTPIDSNKVDEFNQYYYHDMRTVWEKDRMMELKTSETEVSLFDYLQGYEATQEELDEMVQLIRSDHIPFTKEIITILETIELNSDELQSIHQDLIVFYTLQHDTLVTFIDASNDVLLINNNELFLDLIGEDINKMIDLRRNVGEKFEQLKNEGLLDVQK